VIKLNLSNIVSLFAIVNFSISSSFFFENKLTLVKRKSLKFIITVFDNALMKQITFVQVNSFSNEQEMLTVRQNNGNSM